uniref:Uncharacterized protein n=1 Tax=Zea mays TaxID=4577 RepID=C4J8I6_MAIZE|nr:unknown [Zea mays]
MLLQGDRERLLQLLYLQISVRVRQELREMALHQIVDGSCKLWNVHDLLVGQLPNKPSRASSQSSPVGIRLPGGNTEPASRIELVSTSEPSMRIECWPMMHSGSMVQERSRQ